MNFIINNNTCVGSAIYAKINRQYMSPLIGTLIPNDHEYIKFIKNFKGMLDYSINVTLSPKNDTIFEKQTQNKYYHHSLIPTPYPIIQIENVDIHCIHENNCDTALENFKRRVERSKDIIKTNNYKILNILVFTELITDSNDYQQIIKDFLTNEDINTINIFLGPNKYKIQTDDDIKNIYISNSYFDNISLERDSSFIMKKNNQNISRDILADYIINNLI
jgi:uncharacterized protein (DUF1919 family)